MGAADALIGHDRIRDRLLAALAAGRLPHAIMLTGPAGIGKTTLAVHLAATALSADGWPGGLAAHPDLWIEDSVAERIGIERVRAGGHGEAGPSIQDVMALRPYAGGMRVAVLARAERLTEQAADALLKTLEEPPPRTLIVVCTASPDSLPATILSRVQQYPLGPVPAATVQAWLAGRGVAAGLARICAHLCAGRPGRALRLATEPGLLRAEVEALQAFLAVAGGGTDGALSAAAALTPTAAGSEGRERALLLLTVWGSFVRDAVFEASAVPELRVWEEYAPASERWAESLGPARLTDILGLLLRAAREVAQYAQPRLTFETLFLDIFSDAGAPPPTTPAPPLAVLEEAPAAPSQRPVSPPSRRPARRR